MKKDIIALVPARGGSKGVPHKNIRNIRGFPLIAYSIAVAKMCQTVDRVVVSTDSKEIAQIALKFGAEVPFLRPKRYATDTSPDIEFVKHALEWFAKKEQNTPDYLVHLRPTTPLRVPGKLDEAIKLITKNFNATALRSVHELRESPYKLMSIKNGCLEGLFPEDARPEYYNLPRQSFPPVYQPNGYVDILLSKNVLNTNTLHGKNVLAFLTEDTGEIDRPEDLERVEYLLGSGKYDIYEYLVDNFKNDI